MFGKEINLILLVNLKKHTAYNMSFWNNGEAVNNSLHIHIQIHI